MCLFDSHAHLDDQKYDDDRESLIDTFKANNIARVVNIGCDIKTSLKSVELAEKYEFIYATVGIHPQEADKVDESDIKTLENLTTHKKVVAIGEIGLDYHYPTPERSIQKKLFILQIKLARKTNLPIVIHSRDASEDTYEIIKEYAKDMKFLLHCFSQSAEMAKKYIELGGKLAFGGTLTFKNAKSSPEIVKQTDIKDILIETDSPYLTPEPFRGKRNNPTYVKYVAEKIAEIKDMSFEEVARITYDNAVEFYGI